MLAHEHGLGQQVAEPLEALWIYPILVCLLLHHLFLLRILELTTLCDPCRSAPAQLPGTIYHADEVS
jgi:hypothetical protein